MSALPTALALVLVTASLLAPPALPPESTDDRARPGPDGGGDPPAAPPAEGEASRQAPPEQGQPAPPSPPPGATPAPPVDGAGRPRSSLPPGLEPVPFPLEQQRQDPPPPTPDGDAPSSAEQAPPPPEPTRRRSIVDLRDPFEHPPPLPRSRSEREAHASRLLMPDLKDPFAPSVRRVRSKKLDRYVPNDIRDPFRDRPRADGPRPPCVVTTEDGTVVQKPGEDTAKLPACRQGPLDLRDPFTRGGG